MENGALILLLGIHWIMSNDSCYGTEFD